MNTPKTDAIFKNYAFTHIDVISSMKELEVQVQELRRVVAKCNAEFKAMATLGMGDMDEAIKDTNAVLERTK